MRIWLMSRSLLCRSVTVLLTAGTVTALSEGSSAQTAPAPARPTPGETSCTCPGSERDRPKLWPKPKFADAKPSSVPQDEIAALEAVHLALTEIGDGSSYVWHQKNGRLSGVIQPTSSFRDSSGKVCRHVVVALSISGYSRSAEGIACRLADGSWQLDG